MKNKKDHHPIYSFIQKLLELISKIVDHVHGSAYGGLDAFLR